MTQLLWQTTLMPIIEDQKLRSLPCKSAMPVPLSCMYNTFLYYSLIFSCPYYSLTVLIMPLYDWYYDTLWLMSWLHSTSGSDLPWLFLYYIRLWMHVLISLWNVYWLSLSQAWVRFSSKLPLTFWASKYFLMPLCFCFLSLNHPQLSSHVPELV